MIISIAFMFLFFIWLLYETKWLTIRLPQYYKVIKIEIPSDLLLFVLSNLIYLFLIKYMGITRSDTDETV